MWFSDTLWVEQLDFPTNWLRKWLLTEGDRDRGFPNTLLCNNYGWVNLLYKEIIFSSLKKKGREGYRAWKLNKEVVS